MPDCVENFWQVPLCHLKRYQVVQDSGEQTAPAVPQWLSAEGLPGLLVQRCKPAALKVVPADP